MSAVYRLNEIERQALREIANQFPQQQADIPSGVALEEICDTTAIASSVVAHRLKRQEFKLCAAELTGLAGAINRTLTDDNEPLLIVDGLPATRENAATISTVLSLMGNSDLLEYQDFGTLIDAIRDKGIGGTRPTSGNDLHFGLHTDLSFYPHPAPVVNFLMVQPSQKGGESLFCDMREVVKELSAETIAALQSDFLFPTPPRFPDLKPLYAPILTYDGATLKSVRYRKDNLKALSEAQEKALQEFEATIHTHTTELSLASGQAAIFNNQLLLHGRTEFSDSEAEGKKRYAVRAYMRPNSSKQFAPL